MKRTLIAALGLAVSALAGPAHAAPAPSIAFIDTGFNPAVLNGSVIQEACFVAYYGCPNGKPSQEGPGAATVSGFKDTAFDHGTQMVSVAMQVNTNIKVVAIRVTPMASNGTSYVVTPAVIEQALQYVIDNRVKYNIQAVNLSMGQRSCPADPLMQSLIVQLQKVNVPVVAAAGNNGDKKAVDFPACIPEAVAVGYTELAKSAPLFISNQSNSGPQLDFYAPGWWMTTKVNGTKVASIGSSNATAALTAYWVKVQQATYTDTYNYLVSNALAAKGVNASGLLVWTK